MKIRIFRNTLEEWADLAYAWGSELGEMFEYYENEGCCGGYGHSLCRGQRWEWYEDDCNQLGDILRKQGYSCEYIAKVWERNEDRGYVDYLDASETAYGYVSKYNY